MNNNWTIKKLFEEICTVEVKYKLFEKEINEVYFWKLIRFNLFMELTKKLNLYQDAHPYHQQSKNKYPKFLIGLIKGMMSSPLLGGRKVNTLLFPHQRKVNINSKLIDIYSYHLEDKWEQDNENYLIIERPYNGVFMRKSSKIVRHDTLLDIFSLWQHLKPKKDININTSINEIGVIANIPVSKINSLSKESITKSINKFKREYHYYNKILSKYCPEKLYIVNAYGQNSLIAAANDLKIETIEIQHGTITSFHMGYSYPQEITIPYFPQKLSLWGKFWYDISQLPVKEKNISYDGFHFLNQEVGKFSETQRDDSRILFISQGTIGRSLANIALAFGNKYKEFKVIYRLHPSEIATWKTLYPELYSASMRKQNIIIETGNNKSLYKTFAESKFVVGVYSTALIESLAANCKLILVDLPGVEYFQDLIDKNLAKKVKNAEDLEKVLKADDKCAIIASHYFFS